MSEARAVVPVTRPLDAVVTVPGSKSITNRALVCAALASGDSTLRHALRADDTEAMAGAVTALGATASFARGHLHVAGTAGTLRPATVDARQSGTTARFVLPVLSLARGVSHLDGDPQLRRRPMGDGIAALRSLGVEVTEHRPGALPLAVAGAGPVRGGRLAVAGDVSSQFLSGLLMAAPLFGDGLEVELTTAVVSRPYIALTVAVMAAFGADVTLDPLAVRRGGYVARTYDVEPDASTASYFLAAAAVCGGRVTVPGLGGTSIQGDTAFVDILERMGVTVERAPDAVTVRGTGRLRGGQFDLRECSDTAPTLAAVAVFADGPTRVTGVGFIRAKESDRIGAVVTGLRRLGIDAREEPDGFVVHPGTPRPGVVDTYDDHRIAMAFAVVGLRAPGVAIADPGCVAKTFPGFWEALDEMARTGH